LPSASCMGHELFDITATGEEDKIRETVTKANACIAAIEFAEAVCLEDTFEHRPGVLVFSVELLHLQESLYTLERC